MPNIKIDRSVTPSIVVPGVEQDVSKAGLAWGAVAKTADAAADMANAITKAKRHADTTAAKLDYSAGAEQIVADMNKETDLDKIEEHRGRLQGLRERIGTQYGNVAGQLTPYFNHVDTTTGIHIDNQINKVTIDRIAGETEAIVAEYTRKIAYSNDPEERENLQTEMDAYLDIAADYGAIHRSVGEKAKITARQNADLYQVNDMVRTDPAAAKAALLELGEGGAYKNFTNLLPGQRAQAVNHADQTERSNRNQFYVEENRYQQQKAYDVYDMMDKKDLSDSQKISQIDAWMKPDPKTGFTALDARVGYSLKQHIQNGEHIKTDLNTWRSLYQKSLPTPENPLGTLTTNDIMAQVGAGKLSNGDAKSLMTRVMTTEQKVMTAEQVQVEKDLKAGITELQKHLDAYVLDIGDSASGSGSTQFKNAVLKDAYDVSKYMRTPADVKWFNEKYLKDVKTEIGKSKASDYMAEYWKKLQERSNNPQYYEDAMKETGRTSKEKDLYKPKKTEGAGGISAYDAIISEVFGQDAPTAKAIVKAESSFDPASHNPKGGGTGAFGLFQIRGTLHEKALKEAGIIKDVKDLFDPVTNIKAAKFLYDRDGWTPWDESKSVWSKATGDNWQTLPNGKKIRRVG